MEIHVCHAGTCISRGAEAVLTEIEELVSVVDVKCAVRRTGCLGYCRSAPTAVLVEPGAHEFDASRVHVRILSMESSMNVVYHATGKMPSLNNSTTRDRLAGLRATRSRQYAASVCKWNAALLGIEQDLIKKPELIKEVKSLYLKAGFSHELDSTLSMPDKITNYSQWSLDSIDPTTRHSAIFHFSSSDRARGTPHPRGSGRRPTPNTWHVTLLAEVGPNVEGPLPWIERDYTPISSAKDWENGKCDILIKVYQNGVATSWLHQSRPKRVWLSKPMRTLSIPGIVTEGPTFRPSSVLLLLAGTGIVALPQILAHRDPIQQLGISTAKSDQLRVPIDIIFSCREDDVLLLPQIAMWCCENSEVNQSKGIRYCTIILSPSKIADPPYPSIQTGNADEVRSLIQDLSNVSIIHGRLDSDLLMDSLSHCPQPSRVLVSGPASYNEAARSMLNNLIDVQKYVTILSA